MFNFNKKTSTAKLKVKNEKKQLENNKEIKLMNSIIGIEKIINNTVIKSKYGYSVILQISTSDVSLLSEDDIASFESTLVGYSFGLNSPIKYFRSNKRQNYSAYREFINERMNENTHSSYLEHYKEQLFEEFKRIEGMPYNDAKYNYIFIYTPPNQVEERALKDLTDKVKYVVGSLCDTNFRLEPVRGLDLIKFMHSFFNKGIDLNIERLLDSDIFSTYCEGLGILVNDESILENRLELLTEEDYQRIVNEIEEEKKVENEIQSKKSKKKPKQSKVKQNKDEENLLELGRLKIYDVIKPNIFEEKPDYLRLGLNKYCRMLSIQSLPSSMNITTINNICHVEDMEVLSTLKKLDERSLSNELKKKFSTLMSNINIEYKNTGTIDYDKKEAASNIDQLRQLIETNSDKLFHTQNLIKIWADDLKTLEDRTNQIVDTCAKRGIIIRVLFYDQKDAFMTTLPFNTSTFQADKRNVTTGGAACLVPTGCTHLAHKEGKHVGTNMETNSSIVLDNFLCQKKTKESELFSNPNMYVCGKPGSGKSTFMKVFMGRGTLIGEWNAIFDMENEYLNLSKKFGGTYLNIKSGRKTGINPLELSVAEDENGRKTVPLFEKVVEVTNLLNNFVVKYREKGLNGTEITGIQDAVKNIYTAKGIDLNPESLFIEDEDGKLVKKKLPILNDLRLEMEKFEYLAEISEMMKLITGDGIMAMFDCETSEEILNFADRKLVVFCLKELDEFTKFFAMTTILSWLWGLFSDWKYKGIQKNVWIDEGWKFAQHEASLQLLEDFSRRGRKYWTSLIVSTQMIEEFLRTPAGKAIINLCSTKVIFKQDASLAKEITKFFGLPSHSIKRIPSFSKGQCILVTEVGNLLTQVDLFDCEKEFAET
ncbi:MAG: ATP-binding protein [Clostridium sp.]